MDWARYKALCDTPDVCSRWLLQQTLELLGEAAPAPTLRAALQRAPLQKPDDHRGGPETDMFVLTLTLDEVRSISGAVREAAARGVTTSATRRRGLGGFIEAWDEYERHLTRLRPGAERACSPRS